MNKKTIEELTSKDYLAAELQEIFLYKLEIMAGTAKAYRTDESPVAGKRLADLIKLVEKATEEAGADKLVSILPILIELVASSIVELIAENNRKLVDILAKN